MRSIGVHEKRIHYHIGWFVDTFLPAVQKIEQVCLVHLDADFYEPTKLALETWYPRLVVGGYLQLDDYSAYEGCRQATNDFLDSHPGVRLEAYGNGPTYAYYICKG